MGRPSITPPGARGRCLSASGLAIGCAAALLLAAPVLACTGDCDGDGEVTISELMRGVNIVLGTQAMSSCPEFDSGGDAAVTIEEIIGGVKAALDGCPEPVITTIAGSGIAGLNADGQTPLATQFNWTIAEVTLTFTISIFVLGFAAFPGGLSRFDGLAVEIHASMQGLRQQRMGV